MTSAVGATIKETLTRDTRQLRSGAQRGVTAQNKDTEATLLWALKSRQKKNTLHTES